MKEYKNRSGTRSWRVTGSWPDGRRERSNFEDRGDALEYKTKIEKEAGGKREAYQLTRTSLSREELADAENALAISGNQSLTEVVAHYRKLEKEVREISGLNLDQAMAFFRSHYTSEIEEVSIYAARERFLTTRRDLEKTTIRHYENSTRLLLKSDPNKLAHQFAVKDIDKLLGAFGNTNSYNSYRRGINVFFNWAVRYHLCLENPCSRLDKPPRPTSTVAILSPEEIRRLLKLSLLKFDALCAASVALLLFAGLRPSELEDLKPEDIRNGRIRVTGGKLRRNLKRSVEIPPVLKAWLDKYPFRGLPKAWDYKRRQLRILTGAKRWVNDVLRHTSISYQLERDQDQGKVAFANGTSAGVIDRHYRDVIDAPETVDAFWLLTPSQTLLEEVDLDLKNVRVVEWPTDARLRKMVWEKPLSRLAKDLGVSDNAIRKRCKQRSIELPKNGYWQSKPYRDSASSSKKG